MALILQRQAHPVAPYEIDDSESDYSDDESCVSLRLTDDGDE